MPDQQLELTLERPGDDPLSKGARENVVQALASLLLEALDACASKEVADDS